MTAMFFILVDIMIMQRCHVLISAVSEYIVLHITEELL
jgi:hypothetical protein